ncbi:uncharacterized protein JCM10292_003372 [Rhodotorula paludigena]|uniref:uncharacterized protein n=1 Tax=Rhodotorula paludigena TaxID=86838 RepID=UPI00317AB23E
MATKRVASNSPGPLVPSTSAPIYPVAGPPAKKLKKRDPGYEAEQAAGGPEKRLKQVKKSCPQATRERADRVYSQRFFCVDRTRTGEIMEEFKVLGSTGNVYTIKVDKIPTCDCPDGLKGNKCKHQLFVMLKVLGVPQSSNLWYQSALLSTELQAIFAFARPAPKTLLDERVARAYKVATGDQPPDEAAATAGGSATGVVQKRVPQEGDSCRSAVRPHEDFQAGSEQGLVFCLTVTGCGNALHAECFRNWAMTCKPTTCPLCREKWDVAAGAAGGASQAQAGPSYSREGYQNLAAQAGISTKRDTSSYYLGPRRGRRWDGGYGRYGYDEEDDFGYGGGWE